MTPDDEKAAKSAGARFERKCLRQYLQRRLRRPASVDELAAMTAVFDWVKSRQARYEKKPGGL